MLRRITLIGFFGLRVVFDGRVVSDCCDGVVGGCVVSVGCCGVFLLSESVVSDCCVFLMVRCPFLRAVAILWLS